ncbi:hypothetical protein JQX13_28415 [Archangium violaceum]|uniref:DUF6484 domain-containing protein n=1 Tax=Archangium violaceum TaxID=83451 RepID=UPI00193BE021|nr:DUF6484 domain-containing protein [Archangium violaceum]QRK04192.1 hypothetical protein JQX13_28415 [Archangium violaceum]
MGAREDDSEVQVPAVRESILGSRAGWVVGIDGSGRPLVDFEGNEAGPVAALLAAVVDAQALKAAADRRQRAVLLFENGDPLRPFLMGLVQEPSPTPLLDELLEQTPAQEASRPTEAWVDGQRVTIEGKEEVVIRCGAASITLRRNGKVVIKGTFVETSASGKNRIKGGSVEIN